MTRGPLRPATVGAISALLVLAAPFARADITTENTIAVEGIGAMALGNLSGTTRTTISGDRSRTDSDIQMKSRLVRILAHGAVGPTAEIVRLDQDKIYHLNLNKKEYTETSFEQMREQLSKLSDQTNTETGQKEPSAIDESKCEWLPPKVDVQRTGEKQQIAGYDAEHITILASQPCRDKSTGSICEVALGLDEWLAAGLTESAEAQKYHRAYAAKLGLDISNAQDFSKRAQSMFGRYKGIWSELVTKMQGAKGYPVKSSITLALGGEQCQNAKQAQSQTADSGGGSSANTPAALAGQMAGKLGSLFHKKKDDAEASAQPAPAATAASVPPGDIPVMTISTQLVSISNSGVAADAFEVPADFKKHETKSQ